MYRAAYCASGWPRARWVGAARQGRGEVLLLDAVERVVQSMAEIGGIGLLADALNECAQSFYRQYGFESFRDEALRVVLLIAKAATRKQTDPG